MTGFGLPEKLNVSRPQTQSLVHVFWCANWKKDSLIDIGNASVDACLVTTIQSCKDSDYMRQQ